MAERALNESRKRKSELMAKFQTLLQDTDVFQRKIHDEGMDIHYSREDDYLTVTFGEPRGSVSLSSPSGVYFLVDPESGELHAIEVPFFQEIRGEGRLQNEFWDSMAAWIEAGQTDLNIPPKWEQTAGDAIRKLVAV